MRHDGVGSDPEAGKRLTALEVVLCGLILALVATTFGQVVFRYVLRTSLSWSEELARFLLMWLAALSAAYAFKTGSHFALRFVVERFGAPARRALATAVTTVVAAFLATFTYQAVRFTIEVRDQVAPGTGMSMAIPYSSAAVGGALMLWYVLAAHRAAASEPAASTDTPGAEGG